jgi:hypothetical protein
MRRALIAVVTMVVAAAAVVGTAGPASAAFGLVTCVGSSTTNYDPPLTRQPGPVTASYDTDYRACFSTEPGVTSGTRASSITVPTGACASVIDRSPMNYRITWATGASSSIEATAAAETRGATLVTTIDGTVTAGLFAGAAVHQTFTGSSIETTLCTLGLSTLRRVSGIVTLTIVGI